VEVSESTLTLLTYPYRGYLIEQADPVYNMPVFYFNRPQFEADSPAPVLQDYKTVVLENPYLRLTFLPELGGRLYGATIKATGQEVFYHNPVVKPSRYGVLQPAEANWWLAAGGMEWAYPTQEHGYRFGVPWDYRVAQTPNGAAITLTDTAPGRVGLAVTVSLAANSAGFSVEPLLTNQSSAAVPVQVWSNAALTLAAGSMPADTQFVAATDVITIHSRGEAGWTVPGPGRHAPWPQVGQTDLRDYRQWANYLGFFVDNQAAPFLAAVNPNSRLGMVRLGPLDFPGSAGKLFAFGPDFPYRDYTDDDSQYFEIWGGANAAFWADYDRIVLPGQSLGWREVWWPLSGLDGLSWATEQAAIHVQPAPQTADGYILSALLARPTRGRVQITSGGTTVLEEPFEAAPNSPLTWEFNAVRGPINIELTDQQHQTLLNYQFE